MCKRILLPLGIILLGILVVTWFIYEHLIPQWAVQNFCHLTASIDAVRIDVRGYGDDLDKVAFVEFADKTDVISQAIIIKRGPWRQFGSGGFTTPKLITVTMFDNNHETAKCELIGGTLLRIVAGDGYGVVLKDNGLEKLLLKLSQESTATKLNVQANEKG